MNLLYEKSLYLLFKPLKSSIFNNKLKGLGLCANEFCKTIISNFSSNFSIPTNKQLDKKLIAGSIFFGAGWGLIGLCPGPAITSIALFNISSAIFVLAMFVGFYIASKIN